MPLFRKKPVVIEARQFAVADTATLDALVGWINDGIEHGQHRAYHAGGKEIYIRTLEGMMRADLGDWIIKGVNGEIYPCKPDIFAKTYEAV